MSKNVVVVGLDGMDWPLVELLIEEGRLPNVQRVIDDGWSSPLETVMPPMTVPAWGSFSTGKHPGKHGCYDFILPDDSLKNLRPVSGKDVKAERFFEVLSNNGKKVALINLPTTYPPTFDRSEEDIVITSLMTRGSDFVYPPSLVDEIPELESYRLSPVKDDKSRREYINDIAELEETRFSCGKEIYDKKQWDFFFYLISGTDWLQHEAYGELVEDRSFPERDAVLDAYERFDQHLGWFYDQTDDDTLFIVLSDHGFDNRSGLVNVNTMLNNRGYLNKEQGSHDSEFNMRQLRDSNDDENTSLELTNLGPWLLNNPKLLQLARKLYHPIKSKLPFEIDIRPYRPNLNESRAYYPRAGAWGIYINSEERFDDGIVSQENYEQVRKSLENILRSYETDSDKSVFYDIQIKEDRFEGEFASKAPDVTFRSDIYHPHSHLEPREVNEKEHNGHGYSGILCLSGEYIKENSNSESYNLVDLAPTILTYLDQPIISDMDGELMEETIHLPDKTVIDPASTKELIKRYSNTGSSDNTAEVESRLEDLGYL